MTVALAISHAPTARNGAKRQAGRSKERERETETEIERVRWKIRPSRNVIGWRGLNDDCGY